MRPDRLTALYKSYGPAIYARCRLLLADESAAEDATQETFLRVHKHLERVPDAREALYWIYRIATNLCLNRLRDRRTRRPAGDEESDIIDLHDGGDLEAQLGDRDLVRRLITRARPKVGIVAWLHHVDGFDQEEIAAIVGVSRRTVTNRLAQFLGNARKFIRRSAA